MLLAVLKVVQKVQMVQKALQSASQVLKIAVAAGEGGGEGEDQPCHASLE